MAEMQPCLKCGVQCSATATGICRECRRIPCVKCETKFSPSKLRAYPDHCAACAAGLKRLANPPRIETVSLEVANG